jgi:molybdopterin-guanine dinucleotide biosynthesis protein B
MELEELHILDFRSGPVSQGDAVSRSHLRVGGEFEKLPIFNAVTDTAKLADFVLSKTPSLMYDVNPECCGICGFDCRTFLSKCLKGEENINDCVLLNKKLSLKIDGQDITIVPFVENILKNVINGVVKELKGYKKDGKIEIEFTATDE